MRADVRALLKKLSEFEQHTENRFEFQGGQLAEFGATLYGIHVVQELLCEKLGISEDEVKARIEAHQAKMLEQDERLREAAARAGAEAKAEKDRQQAEAAAAEPPVTVVDAGGDSMPVETAFLMPGPAITGAAAETPEQPAPPAGGGDGQETSGGSDLHD